MTCEDYFDTTPLSHISGLRLPLSLAAAHWLQYVEQRVRSMQWDKFCQLVVYRFGKDLYELYIY